jgi:hypothetical protein
LNLTTSDLFPHTEAPSVISSRDILFARIEVSDIALGEYTYSIRKEYPDTRGHYEE